MMKTGEAAAPKHQEERQDAPEVSAPLFPVRDRGFRVHVPGSMGDSAGKDALPIMEHIVSYRTT